MDAIDFKRAYYIKLGRGGLWEKASIGKRKLRFGWKNIATEDIAAGNWKKIQKDINQTTADKGAATRDFNALRIIAESTSDDVWITFYESRLWWGRFNGGAVREDEISKFRRLEADWSDKDKDGTCLLVTGIPGTLSQLQGFRGTACSVKASDALRRLLNNQPSPAHTAIFRQRKRLVADVEGGIKHLHWRDFEVLVDLIFRQSGWRRLTTVGENLKYVDMELADPITQDLYQVQVKSKAGLSEFTKYAEQFGGGAYRRLYFIVHSPSQDLAKHEPPEGSRVEIMLPRKIATMVVDFGLTEWLLAKIR